MTTSPRPLAFVELPYTFRSRTQGESKLDHVVAMEYLIALYDRMFGRLIPVRFAMFSAIGLLGVGVHMAVLSVLRSEEHTSELQSLMRTSYAVFCLKKKKTIIN